MLSHNLLLLYRNFKRFKSSFFINLIGLTSGLACTLLIYLWVNDELHVDKFHENDTRLYQVMENQIVGDVLVVKNRTSGLVAETLAEEVPGIEFSTAVIQSSWFPKFNLSGTEDNKVKATGQFASKDYFNVFSFGLIEGDKNQVLTDKNAIVISESLARKLFSTSGHVLGKVINLQVTDIKKQVTVSGVFRDVPPNSTENFDFVLPFEYFKELSPAVLDWGNDGTNTYAVLSKGASLSDLNTKIAGLIKTKNPGTARTLFLRPYSEGYLYGRYENGMQSGGRIEYVTLFSIVAIFILLIACINFMNLSTAKATRRVKEVGIKKAIGASRKMLALQYMGESMLMSFLSLALALVVVQVLMAPFNQVTGKQLTLTLDPAMMAALFGVTTLTGLIAGSYPALYLSSFNPIDVLKGKLPVSIGELWVRKGLVIFQFSISVILIVVVLVVYKQIEFIQSRNLGYNKDHIIYFEKEGKLAGNVETFLAEMKNTPGVFNASSMWGNMVGGYSTTSDVRWEGKAPDHRIAFEIMGVNHDLLDVLEIKMASGRSFSREFPTDTASIIFNEAAMQVMGLNDPIGKTVRIWGADLRIIGVVKNFHFKSLHENVKPLFIRLQPSNTSIIMARLDAATEKQTIANIQDLYQRLNPGYSFDYQFLDSDYQAQYVPERQVASLSQYFAALAILISCLGLFGLAAFTAEKRMKEIGIRKVLGSSTFSIVHLLTAQFTKILLVAIALALPISYALTSRWLSGFAFRIELEWWYFIGAGLMAILISWITVGLQTIKAAKINPVYCLKNE